MPRKVGLVYVAIFTLVMMSGITGPKEVKIFVDGEEQSLRTYQTHVAEVIAEAGIELRDEDVVTPSREGWLGTEGSIHIHRAFLVYLRVGGETLPVYASPGEAVGPLLARAEITLMPFDQVVPRKNTAVYPGQVIYIQRVELQRQSLLEEIAPEVIYKPDSSLPRGTIRIEEEGSPGLLERVYQVVLVDGEEEGRELLKINVLEEAKPRVILQGTAPRSPTAARGSLRLGDSWQGKASWYGGDGDGFHGRKTASGEIFDSNALTAAHPFLPFGTMVSVIHLNSGREVVVRINDRGPFTGGRIIDLSRAAAEVIGMRYAGVATVKITIIKLP